MMKYTTLLIVFLFFICQSVAFAQNGTYFENPDGNLDALATPSLGADAVPTPSCSVPGSAIDTLQVGEKIISEFIIRMDQPEKLDDVMSDFKYMVDTKLQKLEASHPGTTLYYLDLNSPKAGGQTQPWTPSPKSAVTQKGGDIVTDLLIAIPIEDATLLDDGGSLCPIYGNNRGFGLGTRGDGTTWPNYVIGTGETLQSDICEMNCRTDKPLYGPDLKLYDPLMSCSTDGDVIAGLAASGSYHLGSHDGEVHAAIFDTPVNLSAYSAFQGLRVITEDGVSPPENSGHGSAVAALMVQDFTKHGDLNKVVLHSYEVLDANGKGDLATLLGAMNRALEMDGIKLWNLSLGFAPQNNCDQNITTAISETLIEAAEREIFVVSSAGNSGNNLNNEPQFPAAEVATEYSYTVGAFQCGAREPRHDQGGKPQPQHPFGYYPPATTTTFSNTSYTFVDILAPGENIFVPNVAAGCYFHVSGTSFSAPLISSILLRGLNTMQPDLVSCEFSNQRLFPLPQSSAARHQLLATDQQNYPGPLCFDESTYGHFSDEGKAGFEKSAMNNNGIPTSFPVTTLFPNPATDVLNVTLDGKTVNAGQARVFDSVGRAVTESAFTGEAFKLDIATLPAGVYSIRIERNGGGSTHRFVKR